ncbi:hypothetical protein [Luteolibacter sp. Populi]|uniref:hypothetical protein n=1 Tax=Luteolibacter sp. Populi TaxID=3230487 RepID=UPI0034672514
MIESKHEIGSNAWYDDLEADLSARGIYVNEEAIEIERYRLMFSENIRIRPDTRWLEKSARESGDLPDHMAYDEWVESLMIEDKKKNPEWYAGWEPGRSQDTVLPQRKGG